MPISNGLFFNTDQQHPDVQNLCHSVIESGLEPSLLPAYGVTIFNGSSADLKALRVADSIVHKYDAGEIKLLRFDYYDADNKIVFSRFKVSPCVENKDGKTIKYVQPYDTHTRPYILPDAWKAKDDTSRPIIITEGEKKTLKILFSGQLSIGLAGVFNFNDKETSPAKLLHLDLMAFNWDGRKVYIAFDADFETNPQVRMALFELGLKLEKLGAEVKILTWSEKKGIDDYLAGVKESDKEIQELMSAATPLWEMLQVGHIKEFLRGLAACKLSNSEIEDKLNKLKKSLRISISALRKDFRTEVNKLNNKDNGDDYFCDSDSPQDFFALAKSFVSKSFTVSNKSTLVVYCGDFYRWQDNRYVKQDEDSLKREAYRFLSDKGFETINAKTVSHLMDATKALCHKSNTKSVPSWIIEPINNLPPEELIVCKSELYHLPTSTYLPATPEFFNTAALSYDLSLKSPAPTKFLNFLNEVFSGDQESILTLQEFMGYYMTQDTRQHKILFIVGPRRSGKGTIARIIQKLIGEVNCVGPTAASLAGRFGLSTLIGKSLAIISDARFHRSGDHNLVVERLLCISGEDTLSIERHYREAITVKLPTRFLIMSNEIPQLGETSGALSGRFIILKMDKSFYGKEDPNLTETLLTELPGIAAWAIEGLKRLYARGRFVQPMSGQEAFEELEELSSPAKMFIEEECEIGSAFEAPINELYLAWKRWCNSNGRDNPGSAQSFGRNIKTVNPEIKVIKRQMPDKSRLRFYSGIRLRPKTLSNASDAHSVPANIPEITLNSPENPVKRDDFNFQEI